MRTVGPQSSFTVRRRSSSGASSTSSGSGTSVNTATKKSVSFSKDVKTKLLVDLSDPAVDEMPVVMEELADLEITSTSPRSGGIKMIKSKSTARFSALRDAFSRSSSNAARVPGFPQSSSI